MRDMTYSEALRFREHLDRVQREETEWRAARLHFNLHHNWLAPDECATCLYEAEAFEDDPMPVDTNPEGRPELNGAWQA
jgi:hypothetical protein